MEIGEWLSQNWFNLVSVAGIISGLWFTAISLHSETKTRRIANLLTITGNHREIWQEFIYHPGLARILDAAADPARKPVTREEEIFVNLVIAHINSVYYSIKDELVIELQGLRRDVWWFFSLPVPKAVWEKTKLIQNDDFVAFVESCRNWK
jgi:hypothetical protein